MPRWALLLPLAAAALLGASLALPITGIIATVCAVALIGAVIAAVHHAEVVAHRVGEPFGTLVLAVANSCCVGLAVAIGDGPLAAGANMLPIEQADRASARAPIETSLAPRVAAKSTNPMRLLLTH